MYPRVEVRRDRSKSHRWSFPLFRPFLPSIASTFTKTRSFLPLNGGGGEMGMIRPPPHDLDLISNSPHPLPLTPGTRCRVQEQHRQFVPSLPQFIVTPDKPNKTNFFWGLRSSCFACLASRSSPFITVASTFSGRIPLHGPRTLDPRHFSWLLNLRCSL